ncbi:hypothetical protein, partial [Helicobacter pametensis]
MANTCASTQSNGNNRPIFCVDGVDKSEEAYHYIGTPFPSPPIFPSNPPTEEQENNGLIPKQSLAWGIDNNYYTPNTYVASYGERLAVRFGKGGTKFDGRVGIEVDQNVSKVEMRIKDGKGLKIPSGGLAFDKQKFTIGFDYQTDKTFILDIDGPASGGPSLIGDLQIQHQDPKSRANLPNTFTATLGKGMKGSIWLIDASGNNTVKIKEGNLEGNIRTGYWHWDGREHINSKITIDFTDNPQGRIIGDIFNADQSHGDTSSTASSPAQQNRYHHLAVTVKNGGLQGDIRDFTVYGSQIGNLSVTFEEGATMEGNIMGGTQAGDNNGIGNDHQKKIVTFKGANSASTIVMTGDIVSYGTGSTNGNNGGYKNAGNHVTFDQGSMRGSILASHPTGSSTTSYGRGYNKIVFKQDGAMITSIGKKRDNILAQGGGANDIRFEGHGIVDVSVQSSKGGYNVFNLGTTDKSLDLRHTFNAVGNSSSSGIGRNIIYLGDMSAATTSQNTNNGETYTLKNTKGGTITFTGTGSNSNAGQNLINFTQDDATLYIGEGGRGTLLTTGGHTIINDGYNANGAGSQNSVRIETKTGITVVAHTIKADGKTNGAQNKL